LVYQQRDGRSNHYRPRAALILFRANYGASNISLPLFSLFEAAWWAKSFYFQSPVVWVQLSYLLNLKNQWWFEVDRNNGIAPISDFVPTTLLHRSHLNTRKINTKPSFCDDVISLTFVRIFALYYSKILTLLRMYCFCCVCSNQIQPFIINTICSYLKNDAIWFEVYQ